MIEMPKISIITTLKNAEWKLSKKKYLQKYVEFVF